METIEELERYLEDECYSFRELTIGKHTAPEGYIIEKNGNTYDFCCSERGTKSIVKSFLNEKDLVKYAYERLSKNKWDRAHLVSWLWDEEEIHQTEQELRNMNIAFERNDVPNYSQGKTAYRIFVFGRDVKKLTGFKEKYFKYFADM